MKQRNNILQAILGRRIEESNNQNNRIDFDKMWHTLMEISDDKWGMYAFAREPLERKFTLEQKKEYINKASECGINWAKKIKEKYGTNAPFQIAEKMGMKVMMPKTPIGGGQVLFAQFVEPNEITIFTDCVEKGDKLYEQSNCEVLKAEKLLDILLAHELFHAIEELYASSIYTRTEKIELWKKPFSNQSSIICLSEIAAMAFAKELLQLPCSPYVLDVLLVYGYDKKMAWELYEEICEIEG